jgi:succinate dehydrogenase / fumarate reductase membrane anchor subunit
MSRHAHGLKAWLAQRVSAVYLTIYLLVIMVMRLGCDQPLTYTVWNDWLKSSVMSIFTTLFFFALLLHAWVGIRDILMDYVHPFVIRFSLLIFIAVFLMIEALWVVRILL